ncbi:MAG: hypothetical protein KIS73_12955 [Enhydrobacter sp.]|nr:hypothetical protein [Enhydrobacter sp.]
MTFYWGTGGNDVQNGTSGHDQFNFTQGGDDTLDGKAGNDTFLLGLEHTADDKIDGGDGDDTLSIGQYAYGGVISLTFNATTMINVENIVPGWINNSFHIVTHDATVAEGEQLTFWGQNSPMGPIVFDGSAETDGWFFIYAGPGINTLIGGALGDTFDFSYPSEPHNFNAANQIDGGGGGDLVRLHGNYTGSNALVFGAATMVNVEFLLLTGSRGQYDLSTNYSYDIKTHDATVAAGEQLVVDGSYLGGADNLTFNGSAETDGSFVVYAGMGKNLLTGGAGDDTFHFARGDLGGYEDYVNGGAGFDTVVLDGDYMTLGFTEIVAGLTNVEYVLLQSSWNGANSYNLHVNGTTVASGNTLTIDGASLGSYNKLIFDGSAETDGKLVVLGGASTDRIMGGAKNDTISGGLGADRIDGGAGNDTLDGGDGNDKIAGGDGNDTIVTGLGNDKVDAGAGTDTMNLGATLNANDRIDGGANGDTVNLLGDYASAPLVLGATTLLDVETLKLGAGFDYDLTTHDATVAAGSLLTVAAGALGPGDTLVFNGSAETDGRFKVTAGAADDSVTGGAGDDVIDGGGGNDTLVGGGGNDKLIGGAGIDLLDGGTGADVFAFTSVSHSRGVTRDTVAGFDVSQDSFDLNVFITGVDAALVSGALNAATFNADMTALVNAAALGANHAVLFTASSGDLAGRTFLIADANGVAGLQVTKDYVFEMATPVNLAGLSFANFV